MLRSAIDRLRQRTAIESAELREIHSLRCQFDGLFLDLALLFEKRQGFSDDGARSMAGWLRNECNLSPHQASKTVRTARHLVDMPMAADSLRSGRISLEHAATIAHCVEDVGAERFSDADRILTEVARSFNPKMLGSASRYLLSVVRPDQAEKNFERDFERRQVRLTLASDGMWLLSGQLDAESGALLDTALRQLMPPPSPQDRRSAPQRRADALAELARGALNRKEVGTSGGQKPHLVLQGHEVSRQDDLAASIFELVGVGPIPERAARRIACDSSVSTDEGRESRRIPPSLRRLVERRDRHCVEPGCDAPPSWCDVHHIRHWMDGGATVKENLELRCRRHHREVHGHAPRAASP